MAAIILATLLQVAVVTAHAADAAAALADFHKAATSTGDAAIAALCNDAARRQKAATSPPNCGSDTTVGGVYGTASGYAPIPQFDARACADNWDLGFAVGARFKAMIKTRINGMADEKAWYATTDGQTMLAEAAALHNSRYPDFFHETCGMAAGVGITAAQAFMINLESEIYLYLEDNGLVSRAASEAAGGGLRKLKGGRNLKGGRKLRAIPRHGSRDGVGCSDALVGASPSTGKPPLLGHNEDEDLAWLGYTYVVLGKTGGTQWAAYTYAGDLPSLAFGMNSHGLGFSMNYLEPNNRPDLSGIGSVFIARALLEAGSVEEGRARLDQPDALLGGSFNMIEMTNGASGRVANAEIAPYSKFNLADVAADKWLFHANKYDRVKLSQWYTPSSTRRKAVAKRYTPKTAADVLRLLGDSSSSKYPIFRPVDGDWEECLTMCTVMFDAGDQAMTIYTGNPRQGHVTVRLPLAALK